MRAANGQRSAAVDARRVQARTGWINAVRLLIFESMPHKSLTAAFAERLAAPPRCRPQCDRRDWRDETEPPRKGWIRTVCSQCGTWIGDRRVENKQAAKEIV